jgi:hypothetical protein
MSQYVAQPAKHEDRWGWAVRNTAEIDNPVVKFFPNNNNSEYMPDWHVFKAKLTAWYYNHFRWGENT